MIQRFGVSVTPSSKPDLKGELLAGLGILASGLIYGVVHPTPSRPNALEPAVLAESDPIDEWKKLNGPQIMRNMLLRTQDEFEAPGSRSKDCE